MQMFGNHVIPDSHIIVSTVSSFVFVNIRPFLKNHLLVSPKRIVPCISDLTENETSDLFDTVRRVTISLKPMYDGFTINVQDGSAAGQKVHHVHVHIVPRKYKDLERNDDIYADGALDCDRNERTFEEMEEETNFLRPLFHKNFNA